MLHEPPARVQWDTRWISLEVELIRRVSFSGKAWMDGIIGGEMNGVYDQFSIQRG